jgi:2-polyprenyl-3-methyl-5-hydroxy-6-metoxy-1,4-benzoquinol methylase
MVLETERGTRVLVVISSWGTSNDHYLSRLVAEYRAMPFDVDIVVLSNVHREVAPGVEVVVEAVKPGPLWPVVGQVQRPWMLRHAYREWKRHLEFPFGHKQILASRVGAYDLFVFSEDDTLLTERNIRAFLEVSSDLRDDEIAGFLRYEQQADGNRNFPEVHGHFHWDPSSVRVRGGQTFAFFTNEHSACYVLTQKQLRRAIDTGNYLVGPHTEKYDLLCTVATDPYTQCGFEKLICVSRLEDFLIHHLPNKYVGTEFGVDDSVLAPQVDALLRIGMNCHRPASLFNAETKLKYAKFSKSYYERVRPEVVSAIPNTTQTVLSIGCGWGATEEWLTDKGIRVTAMPLDPVIASHAGTKGMEVVAGDFAAAHAKLAEKRFDCLLLSNVLHLVPDPVEVLSSFKGLLSPAGVSVALVPNTNRQKEVTSKNGRATGPTGNFQQTGIHATSHKTLRSWFGRSGMQVQSIKNILSPRAGKYRRFTLGLADSSLASEFLAVARKA